ncbi:MULTISPECIES: hypothetical protein [unclassified Amycolatopsis]|uniref:hypothetical protein n=1 Tax=unclassified Amycolatopsis TaxID=2618356 RepID=UPI00287447E6|nr:MULTISPECIES: hypothetical protein [unclassified Amycolatopsis]MDS0135936.1 hypothetical protein [Amycolatopsis sp. 505]MDS0145475.1 hypothetical protein [Amycolatopsis sp. CM201R]
MNTPASRDTVDVDVPRAGTYRLGVFYGTNTFVGRLDTPLALAAGRHHVSVRTSDPSGFLGGSPDVTLDRPDRDDRPGTGGVPARRRPPLGRHGGPRHRRAPERGPRRGRIGAVRGRRGDGDRRLGVWGARTSAISATAGR